MRQVLIDALRAAAPELIGLPIAMRPIPAGQDPVWWSSSAVLGDEFVAKFAWSEPAARRLGHEIGVLRALAESAVPFLPEVVVGSTDPVLLVTRRVPGSSLFDVIDSIDRDRAGAQLARFLTALHQPATQARVEAEVGELRMPYAQLDTETIREKIDRWVRPDQVGRVRSWCDWIDETTSQPAPRVLVHGDLHGDNQVWQRDELRVVVDFETAGVADPEFDLRAIPGTGPGVDCSSGPCGTTARCRSSGSWPGICATRSATCSGAAKPESTSRTIARRRNGSSISTPG